MHGVVSTGDGIANGQGHPMRGVPSQGWSQWIAEAMGVCHTKLSEGGATSSQVVDRQLSRLEGRYRIGTLSMGTNDVLEAWNEHRLAANLRRSVDTLTMHCDIVAVLTLGHRLGAILSVAAERTQRSATANELIGALAGDRVTVIDVSDLAGPTMIRGDLVHPTALGQIEIADRAARALARWVPMPTPSTLRPTRRLELSHVLRYPIERARATRHIAVRSLFGRT